MKKQLLLFCLLLAAAIDVRAQSCCSEYTGDFAALAMNADFKASHADPLPLNYAPVTGVMVKFETLDATQGQTFYVPSDKATNNVVILFHEWWGLNDYIKREAERWQEMLGNVDVYAVDLYDGKVATTADEAGKLSSGLNKKRAETIVKGLLSHIGNDKRVATLGWCMGGTWAFTASRLAGEQSSATVMYYGFPEQDAKKVAEVKSDVLYIWPSQDKHITQNVVTTFGEQVRSTGQQFDVHTFDAKHAFANPSNPDHDAMASKQAEQLTLNFLKTKMQLE